MPAGGASSLHLAWQLPREARAARLVQVEATLEVLTPPSVPALYFWALQVDFSDGRGVWGGAHTGLQWNPRYPGGTAVNWGGYALQELGGQVLEGSSSSLPGFSDDPNTRAYPWEPGRPYRFRVRSSPETAGAWRADVTDVISGETTIIRDLYAARRRDAGLITRLFAGRKEPGGQRVGPGSLLRPIVWSEVFAECDAPSVSVRWSDLSVVDDDGAVVRAETVAVNYQAASSGGCSNTSVAVDHEGVVQITNTPRLVEQGAILRLP